MFLSGLALFSPENLLESASITGGAIFAQFLKNACNQVVRFELDGK